MNKRRLLGNSRCLLMVLAIGLCGLQGRVWAQDTMDFTQIERVTALDLKPCKRMEKEFQPALKKIEEIRRFGEHGDKNHVFWVGLSIFSNYNNTGYCNAVSVPLAGRYGQAVLKRFPKEIPVGSYTVHWDPVQKVVWWDSPDDEGDVMGLATLYYDKKNEAYYRVEYWFINMRMPRPAFTTGRLDLPFKMLDQKQLLEMHYRNLLDDLAALFKAGQRDKPDDLAAAIQAARSDRLLMLQILRLQEFLNENYQNAAFLEAEHKRRGDLMKAFEGVRIDDLDGLWWVAE